MTGNGCLNCNGLLRLVAVHLLVARLVVVLLGSLIHLVLLLHARAAASQALERLQIRWRADAERQEPLSEWTGENVEGPYGMCLLSPLSANVASGVGPRTAWAQQTSAVEF